MVRWGIRSYNKPKRVAWCQEKLNWTEEEWKRVVWTDESSFSTAGFHYRPWVTRLPEEEYHEDCVDYTWEFGRKGVMVWGAFCGTLKSLLYIVPPGTTINSTRYLLLILKFIIKFINFIDILLVF